MAILLFRLPTVVETGNSTQVNSTANIEVFVTEQYFVSNESLGNAFIIIVIHYFISY